jgi:hypothetical protein
MHSQFWKVFGAVVALIVGSHSLAVAQDTNIGSGGAELILQGTAVRAHAGASLDQGGVSSGDTRRDLIIGAPGASDTAGKVYVFFGGTVKTGTAALSTADAIISSTEVGNGFGSATAAGNIFNVEGSIARALVVGAPGAGGGRGAVYVFAGGFNHGATRTVADALFTVTGAAGDQLGAALATGDLDGDGYRDLIMGAPGNTRVYVIYGGPALSGSRDLSTTNADVRVSGTGIGSVLTAGDVTGDGPYDVLIGAPTLNLVYLIKGRATRSLAATLVVPADEDTYFVGVGNDGLGTSVRLGDLDNDGRPEILMGAPRGGSAESGAVYVLWGRAAYTPLSMVNADVTFYGPYGGAHLGRMVTSGDINRDSPDDLAMAISGTGGAPDQLLLYYGRARANTGVPGAIGRVVDLSSATNISRKIIGDAAAGPVSSAVIYEVTGEGARDVILGVPSATTPAGAEGGLVYFANSPKMTVRPTSVYVVTIQGSSTPAAITIGNASTVPISWTATPKSTWIGVTNGSGNAVAGASGSFTLTASSSGLGVGQYSGNVEVSSTSNHLTMKVSVPVTMALIAPPTIKADRAFPSTTGETITWTADVQSGGIPMLYQFYRFDSATGWSLVQSYSASNTYTWTPVVNDAGNHAVQVWAKTAQSTALYDTYMSSDVFTVQKAVPRIASFVYDAAFPLAPNTPVPLTVTASGGSGPLQYRFYVYREGTGWTMLRDYGSSNTATWVPTVTGNYALQVWVRSTGIADLYEASASSTLLKVSTTDPVKAVAVTPDRPFPAHAGQTIKFTATASGGSAGPLQYQFYRYDESTGWAIVQPYSASRTYTWTPGSNAAGTHALQVWVRSPGASAQYEDWMGTGSFSVVVDPLTAASLRADVVFPVPSNTPVTWTATVGGGVAPLAYQFWVMKAGSGWTMARDYGSSGTFTWTPASDGTYAMQVWVRNAGSTAAYDTWAGSETFTIGSSAPARVVTISSDLSSPSATPMVWTAVASGGTAGPLQYQFWRYSQSSGTWTLVQAYGPSNKYSWTPSASESGTYALQAWVRSFGSAASYEGWGSTATFNVK